MRSQRFAIFILLLVCLAAGGCRTDPAITLLEQENRRLEDMIYQQQDTIQQYRQAVESCCQEKETLHKRLESAEGERRPPAEPTAPREIGEPTLPETFEPPRIELPPGVSAEKLPETPEVRHTLPHPAGEDQPQLMPTPADRHSANEQTAALQLQTDNTRATRIALQPLLTGGYNMDSDQADEGISLLIQPRDARGQLVAAAAPVSVVVLDPALPGEAARVARWDFTADQVAARYQSTSLGEGIHLEMPWPTSPPVHSRLHLFVRYTTDDGRKLEADQVIEVALAGQVGPRWEPVAATETAPAASEAPPRRQHHGAAQQIELSRTQPVRTASAVAEDEHRPSPPKHQRPVWSPDR